MDKFKKIGAVIAMAFISVFANAQTQVAAPAETGFMHSNGRIYVVVAVVVTILIGIFLYLLALDRKISKLEKN
ncbi:CcmD family protein [Chitinophagaceae bacterium LWZ2-11]